MNVRGRRRLRSAAVVTGLVVATAFPSTAMGFGFVGEWGSTGTGPGELQYSANAHQDLATDAGGNVLVVDGGNHRIQRFTRSGGDATAFGAAGTDPGQFDQVRDVAVDPTGNVWVLDAGRAKVMKFSSAGAFISEFGAVGTTEDVGTFNNPNGLDVDLAGNLYVVDEGRQKIIRFDPMGGFLAEADAYGTDVAVGASGVWIADHYNHRVLRYSSGLGSPTTFGAMGSGPGEFLFPISIAIDGAGRVLVADSGNERLVRLTSSGAWLDEVTSCCGGENWNLLGVGARAGDVYVSNATSSGAVRDTVVQFGTQPPTADFSWSPAAPRVGESVTFTAAAQDPDGTVVAYAWDTDADGQHDDGTAQTTTATFGAAGDQTVRLRVIDDDGAQTDIARTVTVAPAPAATTDTPTTTITPIVPGRVIEQQPPQVEPVCAWQQQRQVQQSIIRGCFTAGAGGTLVSDGDIEVDGITLALPDGSSDTFVVDPAAGTIRTKNASTRIEAQTVLPDGLRRTIGVITRTATGVAYSTARGVKAALGAATQKLSGAWALLPTMVSGVIRSASSVAGEVAAEGKATIDALGGIVGTFFAPITANEIFSLRMSEMTWRTPLAVIGGFEQSDVSVVFGPGGLRARSTMPLPLLARVSTEWAVGPSGIESYVRGQNLPIFIPFGISTFGTVKSIGLDGALTTGGVAFGGQVDLMALVAVLPMRIAGAASLKATGLGAWKMEIPNAQWDPLPRPAGPTVTFRGGLALTPRLWSASGTIGIVSAEGLLRSGGTVSGWISPGRNAFAMEGTLAVERIGNAPSIISSTGYAACLQTRIAGQVISFGVAGTWSAPPTFFAAGCDLAPYRPAPVLAGASQSGPRTITLPSGLPLASIAVEGAGSAPDVLLAGPSGTVTPRTFRIGSTTHLIVGAPRGGTWTVTAQDGSAPITAVEVAHGLPRPDIRADVQRRGQRYAVRYRVAPRAGQTVRFVERGPDVATPIGTAKGAAGLLAFTPAAGRPGRRTIVALVEQDGRPRSSEVVARYSAPPATLSRVPRVRVVRVGRGARVTWAAVRGARYYQAVLRLAGTRPATFTVTARRIALPALAHNARGTIRVTAVAADGRRSSPATGRVRPVARRR